MARSCRIMTELERLALFEKQAEEAYDAMYEAHSPSHAAACYGDASNRTPGKETTSRVAAPRNYRANI